MQVYMKVDRRRFLRGASVSLALPAFASLKAAKAAMPRTLLAVLFVSHLIMECVPRVFPICDW